MSIYFDDHSMDLKVSHNDTFYPSIHTITEIIQFIELVENPALLAILSLVVELHNLRKYKSQWYYDFNDPNKLKLQISKRIDYLRTFKSNDSSYIQTLNEFKSVINYQSNSTDRLLDNLLIYSLNRFNDSEVNLTQAFNSNEKDLDISFEKLNHQPSKFSINFRKTLTIIQTLLLITVVSFMVYSHL